jgi:hypothetical protein
MLDVNKSKFVDFQKVRVQETQAELPRGCIPRRYCLQQRYSRVDVYKFILLLFVYSQYFVISCNFWLATRAGGFLRYLGRGQESYFFGDKPKSEDNFQTQNTAEKIHAIDTKDCKIQYVNLLQWI